MARILGFLLICLMMAALLTIFNSVWNMTDTHLIVCYVILVVFAAFGFPVALGTVSKEHADLVYYLTAIIAGLIFFAAKEGERRRLDLASRIEQATSELIEAKRKDAAAAETLRKFEYILQHRDLILGLVNERVDLALKDYESFRDMDCRCALESTLPSEARQSGSCGFGVTIMEPQNRRAGGLLEQESIASGYAVIAAGERCDKEGETLKAAAPFIKQSPRSPDAILRLAGMLPMSGTFDIADASIDFKTAVSALQLDEAGVKSQRVAMTQDNQQHQVSITTIEQALTNLRKENEEAIMKSKSGIGLYTSLLSEKYWPYVLIALLGLKIARVRYLPQNQKSMISGSSS